MSKLLRSHSFAPHLGATRIDVLRSDRASSYRRRRTQRGTRSALEPRAAERLRPRTEAANPQPPLDIDIFASASSTVNGSGFCTAGKSLNVSTNLATAAWAA